MWIDDDDDSIVLSWRPAAGIQANQVLIRNRHRDLALLRLNSGAIGVLYFAGHGYAVRFKNMDYVFTVEHDNPILPENADEYALLPEDMTARAALTLATSLSDSEDYSMTPREKAGTAESASAEEPRWYRQALRIIGRYPV